MQASFTCAGYMCYMAWFIYYLLKGTCVFVLRNTNAALLQSRNSFAWLADVQRTGRLSYIIGNRVSGTCLAALENCVTAVTHLSQIFFSSKNEPHLRMTSSKQEVTGRSGPWMAAGSVASETCKSDGMQRLFSESGIAHSTQSWLGSQECS